MNIPKFDIQKLIITIAVIAVIIIAIVYLKKLLKRDQSKQSLKELDKLINKSNLSYDNPKYSELADRLLIAMSGLGTDEKTIFDVFEQMKTQDDILQLIKAFGIKETKYRYSNWKGNLIEWLQDELSSSDIDEINKIIIHTNYQL